MHIDRQQIAPDIEPAPVDADAEQPVTSVECGAHAENMERRTPAPELLEHRESRAQQTLADDVSARRQTRKNARSVSPAVEPETVDSIDNAEQAPVTPRRVPLCGAEGHLRPDPTVGPALKPPMTSEPKPHVPHAPAPMNSKQHRVAWVKQHLNACIQQVANLEWPKNPYVQAMACGALLGVIVGTCLPAGIVVESVLLTQVICKLVGMGLAAGLRYLYDHPMVCLCALAGAAAAVAIAVFTCGAGLAIGIAAGLGGALVGGFLGHKAEKASTALKVAVILGSIACVANLAAQSA